VPRSQRGMGAFTSASPHAGMEAALSRVNSGGSVLSQLGPSMTSAQEYRRRHEEETRQKRQEEEKMRQQQLSLHRKRIAAARSHERTVVALSEDVEAAREAARSKREQDAKIKTTNMPAMPHKAYYLWIAVIRTFRRASILHAHGVRWHLVACSLSLSHARAFIYPEIIASKLILGLTLNNVLLSRGGSWLPAPSFPLPPCRQSPPRCQPRCHDISVRSA